MNLALNMLGAAGLVELPDAPPHPATSALMPFTQFTFPKYEAAPFHDDLARALDGVLGGTIDRLMIFAPPQHGKSELVSVRLPAYALGKRPDWPVILASYEAGFAQNKSRQAREIVESDEYGELFPGIRTHQGSRAVNHWSLQKHRGFLHATGMGGPVTGHGGMLGIIDDPVKNWMEAQSLTIRENHWQWYRTTFRTRIWEHGAIILVMTRWHEDDLAGRILQDQGDRWTVLRYPAIAETQVERDTNNKYLGLPEGEGDPLGRVAGEALAPSRFSIAALADLKTDVGSLAWNAEYQGVPRQPEGNRFKRDWFEKVAEAPFYARRIRYWDKAATEGGGSATAGVLIAFDPQTDNCYIEDVVVGHWSSYNREEQILKTAIRDGQAYVGQGNKSVKIYVEQEPGSGGKDSVDATIRKLVGFVVRPDRPTGDKDTRLEPFAAYAEAGRVKIVAGEWNASWIEQMTSIPHSKLRDQADATAGALLSRQ